MDSEHPSALETVCLAGGLAMVVFGVGLIAGNPGVRRLIGSGLSSLSSNGENPLAGGLGGMLPDVERYLRLKSM